MDASLGIGVQYAVIAVAALVSAWVVLARQFPGAARRLRVSLAVPMVRVGRPAWMMRLGRRVAPAQVAGGDGCGTCGGCAPPRG
ncbi:MAG TPA: DUF6587 family protein [Luteimonas sp.]|nr:DUF6587 family protein [Luteimonas sp.]